MSFGITGERANSTKSQLLPSLLTNGMGQRKRAERWCAEAGEKAEQSEPRCKSCVGSPAGLHYRARGAGCAAGPPPQRWWPRRCSGRRLRAGPCQAAAHGPRPPAVPKHREEPCDTPVPSTAARWEGEWTRLGSSPPNRGSWNEEAAGSEILVALGPAASGAVQLGGDLAGEGQAGRGDCRQDAKNCSSHGKSQPLQALTPEHASTGDGSSWQGRTSPGEGNYS